jgi:hypothetical protein
MPFDQKRTNNGDRKSMVTYSHTIGLQQGQSLNLTTDLIRVTRRDELAPALKQRTKPVVIDNGDLERAFSRLEFWSGREGTYRFGALLVAALLALALALQYKLDFSWQRDWKQERLHGKIVLTPTKK